MEVASRLGLKETLETLRNYGGKEFIDRQTKERKTYVLAANAVLIAAALIAVVTFTAEFMPLPTTAGSFSVLSTSAAAAEYAGNFSRGVEISWVFNSISFFFAIVTLLTGAGAVLPSDAFVAAAVRNISLQLLLASTCLWISVLFLVGAFVASGVAALPRVSSHWVGHIWVMSIGGLVCCIAIFFFLRKLSCRILVRAGPVLRGMKGRVSARWQMLIFKMHYARRRSFAGELKRNSRGDDIV